MRTALIMAGGQGQRMARSGVAQPKPLVPIGGTPLIEHNLQQLVRAGFRRIAISVAADQGQIRGFIADRLVPLGGVLGVEIEELVETAPLGNIGAAGLLADRADSLLVVFADNLTTLDLAQIDRDHRAQLADLTLAVHAEPFRLPFGQVHLGGEDGVQIVDYVEKPTHEFLVCSAIMVLGQAALRALDTRRPTGISDLCRNMLAMGARVRAWPHRAAWTDVNDAAAIDRAERMLAAHPDVFDTWWPGPVERWHLVVDGAGRPGVGAASISVDHLWLPLDAMAGDDASIRDVEAGGGHVLGRFDTVDLARGVVVRAIVSVVHGDGVFRRLSAGRTVDRTPDAARLIGRVAARRAA
jgi:NDP-sugar pyrophosphorylase family protein